jgi:thiosulfate/3-mercaptopyruvate sulfurtransferase
VPGARNVDVGLLARCEAVEQVHELVGLPPGAEIAAYCHSGSRSALAVQVLRAAGYEARNYEGSWHEWSRREDLSVET